MAKEPKTKDEKDADAVLETLQPSAEPREWTLGTEDTAIRTYTQKPLSYMRKMQFFALVGSTIRQALAVSGEGSLNDIIGPAMGGRSDTLSPTDFRDAESFIAVASSLAVYVPDFLEDAYLIWLNVPIQERKWAKDTMSLPEDEGGLSDEDGIGIIKAFIEQNWTAITDFFVLHLPGIFATIQGKSTSSSETVASDPEEASGDE